MDKEQNKENQKDNEKMKLHATNAVISSNLAAQTANTTEQFNNQCANNLTNLGEQKAALQAAVGEKLKANPNYDGLRQEGVKIAYKYEKADVEMGGAGSANWNMSERKELCANGHVRGAEGHHINSVADHPEMQASPDNIEFFKSRTEHLQQGHNGSWRNPSSGPLIDKGKMLKETNRRRVFQNELYGFGIAGTSGAVAGLVNSIIDACCGKGWSLKKCGEDMLRGVMTSLISYTVSRGVIYCFRRF